MHQYPVFEPVCRATTAPISRSSMTRPNTISMSFCRLCTKHWLLIGMRRAWKSATTMMHTDI
jgi:hypothetical protein